MMQHSPPPKPPSWPFLTVQTNKRLPDASNPSFLDWRPITPISGSPTKSRFSEIESTHLIPKSQKHIFAGIDDSASVGLVTTPIESDNNNAPLSDNRNYDSSVAEETGHIVNPGQIDLDYDSDGDDTYNINAFIDIRATNRLPLTTTKFYMTATSPELILGKLLEGAKTLTQRDQQYILRTLKESPQTIPVTLLRLAAKNVVNNKPTLLGAIMNRAQRIKDLELEKLLADKANNFDMESAFNEGLMGLDQLDALMDYQIELDRVRKKLAELAPRAKMTSTSKTPTTAVNSNHHVGAHAEQALQKKMAVHTASETAGVVTNVDRGVNVDADQIQGEQMIENSQDPGGSKSSHSPGIDEEKGQEIESDNLLHAPASPEIEVRPAVIPSEVAIVVPMTDADQGESDNMSVDMEISDDTSEISA
ncbi:hypothetical protein F4802DRAFT_596939 [Xylaria palmicola]|nr:hypothetical protein F4802DRAFT_596939 [Xylaria palmicola]